MSTMEYLISFLSLTLMEIVLGIDNVIFVSILVDRLHLSKQRKARIWGLSLAMICRILLLFTISWLVHLTNPMFTIFDKGISIKDSILILGGLFLIYKSTKEIYEKIETEEEEVHEHTKRKASFSNIITQIIVIDIIFSLDSVITAVGLVDTEENPATLFGVIEIPLLIIIVAVIASMCIMMIFSRSISEFINKKPSIKVLALAFLILIGTMLVAEGLHVHFPKGYIYFAMVFALLMDFVNMRMNRKKKKIHS
jgi:predicted tellurium resistance membrane protein TerC